MHVHLLEGSRSWEPHDQQAFSHSVKLLNDGRAAQFVAFALYCTPLLYMFEKLLGVHEKSLWLRLPCRLPLGEPLPSSGTAAF